MGWISKKDMRDINRNIMAAKLGPKVRTEDEHWKEIQVGVKVDGSRLMSGELFGEVERLRRKIEAADSAIQMDCYGDAMRLLSEALQPPAAAEVQP